MTYFTGNPLERMMTRVPRSESDLPPPPPNREHPCYGCKRYGEGCALPCYRGIQQKPGR